MISLVLIFGVMAVGGAAVIYGTFAKNRWGINTCDVLCPRCDTLLPRARRPLSVRQEMWGGWVCPSCNAEVDKWGRELHSGTEAVSESSVKDGQAHQPPGAPFFGRFRGRSPIFWAIVLLLVSLDIWYDYYSPRAIVFDVIAAIVLFVWYRKSRHG